MHLDANATGAAFQSQVAARDLDDTERFATDKLAAGGNHTVNLLARRINSANEYRGRLLIGSDRRLVLVGEKVSGGVKSTLPGEAIVPGVTHTANAYYWICMQAVDTI